MNNTHHPELKSWVKVPENSDFPIQNLPYGVFKLKNKKPRIGVAIGDYVLDLAFLYKKGYLDNLYINNNVFKSSSLNKFIALGKSYHTITRARISELLNYNNGELRDKKSDVEKALIPQNKVSMLLPVQVPNYTDFYSSLEHASNVGKMFRPDAPPLLPNWKHIPVGYHGRASSIVISGTPVKRPLGQTLPEGSENPIFGPSKSVDFELETGFIIGAENGLGKSISVNDAENYIFGMVLFNDWSARDIQRWEYVPLGPFLAKNFASSMSPWVVTMEALEPFKVEGPVQDPAPLDYLQFKGNKNYDIHLEVYIQPEGAKETLVCKSNHKYLYWNMAQQLAHHTVNGCNMQIGDVCASGTISGPTPDSFGSMLELAWKGTKPLKMEDGSERKFIEDNDTVIMRGYAYKHGVRIGFGEVSSKLLPTNKK